MIGLNVFDLNFERLGEISEYKQLIIDRNYTKVSMLTLKVATSEEMLNLLKHDIILTTEDDLKYGYIIEHFYYTDKEETEIEIHAYSLNFILSWRSIIKQQLYKGNVEDVIKNFIKSNCISPTDTKRIIPNLRLAPNTGIDITTESSGFGINLEKHCFNICKDHEISIDILLNHDDKKFDVVVWQGKDRSSLQNENPHVIFSKEYENVITQSYVNSKTDHKTTAYVCGEEWYDEGRLMVAVDDNKSGFDRREIFIDSSLTSEFTDDEGINNVLSKADYEKILQEEGKEVLKEHQIIETFESEVEANTQFIFGKDYDLGDIVTNKNDEINKTIHSRVISYKLTSDKRGTDLSINFGAPIPTPIDKLKKEMRS